MSETLLDTKGLLCPLPVFKARKALKSVPAGGLLRVLATDPASVIDFKAFCLTTGHELVENNQEGKVFVFLIRRKEDEEAPVRKSD